MDNTPQPPKTQAPQSLSYADMAEILRVVGWTVEPPCDHRWTKPSYRNSGSDGRPEIVSVCLRCATEKVITL